MIVCFQVSLQISTGGAVWRYRVGAGARLRVGGGGDMPNRYWGRAPRGVAVGAGARLPIDGEDMLNVRG
jgi:hypothetical protein